MSQNFYVTEFKVYNTCCIVFIIFTFKNNIDRFEIKYSSNYFLFYSLKFYGSVKTNMWLFRSVFFNPGANFLPSL